MKLASIERKKVSRSNERAIYMPKFISCSRGFACWIGGDVTAKVPPVLTVLLEIVLCYEKDEQVHHVLPCVFMDNDFSLLSVNVQN